MNVKNSILIFCLITILTGCCALKSPVKRYDCQKQRASEKIIVLTKKFPELLQTTDTIRLLDTIQIKGVDVDTSFVFATNNDTIVIEREKLKIKYVKVDSLIYLSGECEGDTIFIDREIPIEKIVVQQPPFMQKMREWIIVLLIVSLIVFVIRKFRWLI